MTLPATAQSLGLVRQVPTNDASLQANSLLVNSQTLDGTGLAIDFTQISGVAGVVGAGIMFDTTTVTPSMDNPGASLAIDFAVTESPALRRVWDGNKWRATPEYVWDGTSWRAVVSGGNYYVGTSELPPLHVVTQMVYKATSSATTHSIFLPSQIEQDDLLIFQLTGGGQMGASTNYYGFQPFSWGFANETLFSTRKFWKWAVAADANAQYSWYHQNAQYDVMVLTVVRGAGGNPSTYEVSQEFHHTSSTHSSVDLPSFTTVEDTGEHLWLYFGSWQHNNTLITATPSTFSNSQVDVNYARGTYSTNSTSNVVLWKHSLSNTEDAGPLVIAATSPRVDCLLAIPPIQ